MSGSFWPTVVVVGLAAAGVGAHPAHLGQATFVTVGATGIDVELQLSPGSQVAAEVVAGLDRDGDGDIADDERAAAVADIAGAVSVVVDGDARSLSVVEVVVPSLHQLATGQAQVRLRLRDGGWLRPGPHHVVVENRYAPVASEHLIYGFAAPPHALTRVVLVKQGRDPRQEQLSVDVVVRPGVGWLAGGAVIIVLSGSVLRRRRSL